METLDSTLQGILTRARSSGAATASSDCDPVDARREAIDGIWVRSGVPKRYADVSPATKPVGWTYITGPVGTGKTHGACSMLRRYIEDATYEIAPDIFTTPMVRFVTAAKYLASVRDSYGDRDDDRADACLRCDCLVLDDLGQEVPTAWAVEQIYDLIHDRYNDERVTIVTSQFDLGSIANRLAENGGREQAEAIASRLAGCCTAYRLTGPDRRVSNG